MAANTTASARDVARRVVRTVLGQQGYVGVLLDAELEEAGLDSRDRRLATELVYGVFRHLSRIDRALEAASSRGLKKASPAMLALLRVGAYQLLFLDRVPAHAAVSDAVNAARKLGGQRLAGFANGVLRRLAREGEPALPPASDARAYAEVACSLPGWIVDQLAAALGQGGEPMAASRAGAGGASELAALAQAMSAPAPLAIRVHGRRISARALMDRLMADHPGIEVRESRLCPGALSVSGLGDPERSPSFREGLFTVQDIGAQLVAHLVYAPLVNGPLAPAPESTIKIARVLDACAGVGGKAIHLAELAGEGAAIDAADRSPKKLALLGESALRLGASGIRPVPVDWSTGEGQGALAPAYDAVVVDAPCTGLGVIRRHPEAKWRVEAGDVARLAEVQRNILEAVLPRVRPGGVLVYSVCTFTEAEGMEQVLGICERHREFVLAPPGPGSAVPWPLLVDSRGCVRTWPHRHEADGFFAARLVRTAG